MTQVLHDSFFLHAPRVFEIHASQSPQRKGDASWTANVYQDDGDGYIVIAELVSSSEEGTVSVTLGGMFQPAQPKPNSADVSSLIGSSTAFETLYDVARQAAHGVGGLANVNLKFALKAPEADVTFHADSI